MTDDGDRDGDPGEDEKLWGHVASPRDRRAVTALVKRYYALAAAVEGSRACSLIYSIFAEEIPEVYGQPPGPPELRGGICGTSMSRYFRKIHARLRGELASLRVTGVRVQRLRGLALLHINGTLDRGIWMHRERGRWKIDALLDNAVAG